MNAVADASSTCRHCQMRPAVIDQACPECWLLLARLDDGTVESAEPIRQSEPQQQLGSSTPTNAVSDSRRAR